MAIIDASVYVALVNAQEKDYARSWTWLERARGDREAIIAPAILMTEAAAALSRGAGDPALAHRVVQQLERGGIVQLIAVTLPLAQRAAAIEAFLAPYSLAPGALTLKVSVLILADHMIQSGLGSGLEPPMAGQGKGAWPIVKPTTGGSVLRTTSKP